LLAAGALALPVAAQTTYTMTSLNSSVGINVNAGGSTPAGMASWLVDGVNQVQQQWFYYRIGDSSANQSIDTIGSASVLQTANTLSVSYTNSPSTYYFTVKYTLTGGSLGSGQSSLGETVRFFNTSPNSLALSLFDYSAFDLGGVSGGQSVAFSSTTLGPPFNPQYENTFTQTVGSLSLTDSAISANNTSLVEANYNNSTLQTITDGGPSSLDGVTSAGPGAVTGAMEWDVNVPSGSSLLVSKTISMAVPEPSSVAMMGLGCLAWLATRRFFNSGCKN